jgi:hypothetical protein
MLQTIIQLLIKNNYLFLFVLNFLKTKVIKRKKKRRASYKSNIDELYDQIKNEKLVKRGNKVQ